MASADFTPAQYRAALTELLEMVMTELDPDPAPWGDYFTNPVSKRIATALYEAGDAQ